MIRSALVAGGYRSVLVDAPELAEIPRTDWHAHGFASIGEAAWKAEPWLPSWLDHHGIAPDEAPARRTSRRPNWRSTADNYYTGSVGHAEYLSPGQKASVRAVSAAQEGDSVICVLPTGSGKTEVVLTRAINNRPRQSCIVVPTVALGLDLERRVQDLTGEPIAFAYHGGLTTDDKAELAQRVREGTQWLIITSPEAACTVLARPLEVSASEGRLDLFAIDEAHIIADWGDDFRPAFQTLAGLRRRMLASAPIGRRPVTAMLTATLDGYGLETLRRLFRGERDLLVSAQATRPEPAWWMSHCETEDEKRARFLELCRHLPRPLLVYTTLHTSERSTNVHTALSWLRAAGLNAVKGVAGDSTAKQRSEVARGLRLDGAIEQDLDIVVATSAFGLGIDIPGVRGVIHLCAPESVDRLYQEVGRSGRDGNASVSIVLWTDSDARVAQDLAEARLIGDKKAWKRWQSMSLGVVEDDLVHIDLTAATDDVTYPWSDANRYWNVQTLCAMDRAEMISLEWPTPPNVPVEATDEQLQDIFAAHRHSTSVRVLQGNLSDESAFRERFKKSRAKSRDAAAASTESATSILNGLSTCVNRYLANHYQLRTEDGVLPVARQCGGCPDCRARRLFPVRLSRPAFPLFAGTLTVKARMTLHNLAPDGQLCIWTDGLQPDAEEELVSRLVDHGIVALISRGPWSPRPRSARAIWWEDRSADLLVAVDALRVPCLVRMDDTAPPTHESALLLSKLGKRPLTVVLTSRDYPDPFDDRALLRESWGPSYRIDHVLRRF